MVDNERDPEDIAFEEVERLRSEMHCRIGRFVETFSQLESELKWMLASQISLASKHFAPVCWLR